jgi:hypothetical protein
MLDADELHRLIALRAASADNVTVYAAVLSALVAAKVAYRLQVRTDDLVGDLAGVGSTAAGSTMHCASCRPHDRAHHPI